MKTFQPRIEVRLIKTAARSLLGPGVAASSRVKEFPGIDLTPFLMEGAAVHVQQYLGGGAGTWSLELADKAATVNGYNETLYGLIEPMDMVEIRMARSPSIYKGKLPIAMRGFVSSIQRVRSMSGGAPYRRISLGGHDFAKVLEILRIYYLNNSVVGDNIIGELGFFQKYAQLGDAKIMSGRDFVALVLDNVINPYIERLTRDAQGEQNAPAVIKELTAEVTIEGTVSPIAVSLFNDGAVRDFLGQFLDIGAFNEMFIDDREESAVLVIRPNQFLDLGGKLISGQQSASSDEHFPADYLDIADDEIETIVESRSDAGVANYYWVSNGSWQYIDTITTKQLADASGVDEYVLNDYPNASPGRFGFRKMEVASNMGPDDQVYGDAEKEAAAKTETEKRIAWLTARRKALALQNRDNAILETGQITMPGNEKVKRGMYLRLDFGAGEALYYVVGVTHTFVPFQSYRTTAVFERGTGFVERAKRAHGSYYNEMNLKGAYESGTSSTGASRAAKG